MIRSPIPFPFVKFVDNVLNVSMEHPVMDSIPVFCGKDCGGNACPLLATVEDGRVTRVANNPAGGKYLKGCPRGFDLPLDQYAPDRILTPLVRIGPRGSGQFRQASWDEALQTHRRTAGRDPRKIRRQRGAEPGQRRGHRRAARHLAAAEPVSEPVWRLHPPDRQLQQRRAAGLSCPTCWATSGQVSGFDAATMQYSEMIILWGANVLETRQGAEVPQRLVEAKQRGAQIVVIDPRRSATVQADRHLVDPLPARHRCRPDAGGAARAAHRKPGRPRPLSTPTAPVSTSWNGTSSAGWRQARTPQWAEPICGVPAEEITRFARAYAAAKPAMLLPGYSIQRVFAGEETYRLTVALQIATGNFGRRGGSTGSINNRLPDAPGRAPAGVPAVPGQPVVPVLRWPDAVLEGRSGGYPADIHAIYNLGSNFLNQGSDIRKSMAAFEKVDFAVSHEVFLTPTARYCDVVFPAATALEKEDIGIPWVGNYLLYKPAGRSTGRPGAQRLRCALRPGRAAGL